MHAVDCCFYDISVVLVILICNVQLNQLSSHTRIDGTGGGLGDRGNSSIDMILFYDFHQSSLGNNNWRDIILSYDLSIGDSTISPLTMINGTLIQDIVKKDIGDIKHLGKLFLVISITLKRKHFNTTLH